VARQALDDAERELTAGSAAMSASGADARFSGVAVEWLLGLVRLSRGDAAAAQQHFDRELAAEGGGHLYARECCANVWYAIGAMRWREGDRSGAHEAFAETLRRVEGHPLAAIMSRVSGTGAGTSDDVPLRMRKHAAPVDSAIAKAVALTCDGQRGDAAAMLDAAIAAAPPGNGGWILPVEPLLRVGGPEWEPVLARLRSRSA
jgi:hypothetical protein